VADALRMPGVVRVVTSADLAGKLMPLPCIWIPGGAESHFPSHPMGVPGAGPILATDRVRYIGDPIAAVVAETREQAEEALAAIPPQLWWDTLALICRFFPGLGSESFSRHFGAGQEGGLEAVYDAPLRLLDSLILRTRAALFSDWRSNLEIGGLINSVSASL